MKHFVKKHTHHFGLWALSGLLLIWSVIWMNNLDKSAEAQNNNEIASSLTAPRNDSMPHVDKQKTKPITAGALADNVISDTRPTEKTDVILKPAYQTGTQVQDDNQQQTVSVIFKIITPTTNKEFTLQVLPQSTVYDAMKQLQLQIPVKFKDFGGLGAFVEEIDNLANNSKSNLFWIYYINGQAAKLGISSIKLNPNDIITWQYEEAKY